MIIILKLNQEFTIRVNSQTLNHYKLKGYNVEMNKSVTVKAEDLTNSSDIKVIVICDYCNKEIFKTYKKYISQRKSLEKDCCYDCFDKKQKEICLIKYGVDCTLKNNDVKLKSKESIKNKYNVDNVMQNPNIQKKVKNTMFKRYGCEYSQQSDEIKNKTKQNNIKKYGVEYPIYLQDIKDKIKKSFNFINGIRVSKAQLMLAEYFKASINLNIGGYYADIVLLEEKIIIEYNGSGHRLSVKHGTTLEEDFNSKELNRLKYFNDNGWKCLVIENSTEKKINKKRIDDIDNIIKNIINNNIINTTFYYIN